MKTTVEYATRVIDGKECRVKITREIGLQEVVRNGTPTLVESVTYTEWPDGMGVSKSYTIARPPKTPDEEAAFLSRVREVVTDGLIAQGIW